jgi:hypothetical protein
MFRGRSLAGQRRCRVASAAACPALVRSRMFARSNSATAIKIFF